MAATRKLKIAFQNSKGGTTYKYFNHAKAKNQIDLADLTALVESMISNTDIFTVTLTDVIGVSLVTTDTEEITIGS